jgi:hypothetical protein
MHRIATGILVAMSLAGTPAVVAQRPPVIPVARAAPAAGPDAAAACAGVHCHHCGKVCRLTIDTEDVTRTCFEVECQPICIPPVTFPWQASPCGHGTCAGSPWPADKCARIRYVRVPMQREYKAGERCVCKWDVQDACQAPQVEPLPAPEEDEGGEIKAPVRQVRYRPDWLRWPWR